MPCSYDCLTYSRREANAVGCRGRAESLGTFYNMAVVDADGHLLAFTRQDGALSGSIDLAINKAVTARLFDKPKSERAHLAQPGKPPFGIQASNAGKIVISGGGIPAVFDGRISGEVQKGSHLLLK
ncbi:GlcG/HbpS family heme-binding protein [Bradyrhizobium sp. SZCCHNR2035]|uniref:GlcG/HbpS family heme-binding protein n=1 Tax=Bradyrhizobium sp. SZCCHNR2035 TaxID=3057386 RepID=UPI003966BC0F